jgi:hypothetical protein
MNGCLIAQLGQHPIILCLQDMTGERPMAKNLLEVADGALKRKNVSPKSVLAVCTDNPTTMQAFREQLTGSEKYLWIIVS